MLPVACLQLAHLVPADSASVPGVGTKKSLLPPFERLPFHHAMARYGSDKPDRRFGLPIADITAVIAAATAASGATECGFAPFDSVLQQFDGRSPGRWACIRRALARYLHLPQGSWVPESAGFAVELFVVYFDAVAHGVQTSESPTLHPLLHTQQQFI